MVNDFALFVDAFREWTSARLVEFEKILAAAQKDVESSVDKALLAGKPAPPEEMVKPGSGVSAQRSPGPRRASNRVHGVLRRG